MIKSFACKDTRKIFEIGHCKKFPSSIYKNAIIKLAMLNRSGQLHELNIPPSNRLEKLRGNRTGQYSIRINDQYRICFNWLDNNAYNVEIVDYH
ncbi:MAG: type II toxin-antitoxin system RelE/ParE family toxin [Candidatus Margulisbacteria bacterium]|jgi:proteic killer suppression protein|nr:type II toxin-antitoxin system RelE/ParE family toxin [Candidatus Margulisiibacteriota bacterium]